MYCFGTVGLQIGGVHKQLCCLIFIFQCVALKLKTGKAVVCNLQFSELMNFGIVDLGSWISLV